MEKPHPLTLDETALTGVEEIDRQHQNLINLVNRANLTLARKRSPSLIRSMVGELLAYTICHFNAEESLMRQCGYTAEGNAGARAHIAQHREFARTIVSIQEKLQKREYVDAGELLDFLTGWVEHHVLDTDRELARLILDRRRE